MNVTNNPQVPTRIAAPVMDAVHSASARTGIDFDYLVDVARVESGYNPTAKAPTSSARGLYQFTKQTWLATLDRHGANHGLAWAADAIGRDASGRLSVTDPTLRQQIFDLRDDPGASSNMAAALTGDNRDYLESRIGRSAEPVDLYLAHFLGSGGAAKFLAALEANPDQPGASMMPEAAAANRSIFYAPDGSMRSLAEIRDRPRRDPRGRRQDRSGDPSSTLAATAWREQFERVGQPRRRTSAAANDGNSTHAAQTLDGFCRRCLSAARLLVGRRRMSVDFSLRNIGRIAGASALPVGMLILVGLMVIPVSPLLLDISFVANIMISLAILMVALSAAKPLDFSSFPTVLLLATLFRLALNVASTRVVLVHGHEGTAAAGHVIEAFGQVLIGGDYVVGLFVFSSSW